MERDVVLLVGHVQNQHTPERLIRARGSGKRLGDLALPAGASDVVFNAAFDYAQQAVNFGLVDGGSFQCFPGTGQQLASHSQQGHILQLNLILVRLDDVCADAIFGGPVEIVFGVLERQYRRQMPDVIEHC
jgi:hypothetical protein